MNNKTTTPFDRDQDLPLFESAGHQEVFTRLKLMVENH